MQTKKLEIKEQILAEAQKEFLIHGYEGASMRVIAKKANTTLGNIYHYYPNKQAILEEVLKETVQRMELLAQKHLRQKREVQSIQELEEALKDLKSDREYKELEYLMDERLLILFDMKTTRFADIKNSFIKELKQHLAWHLGMDDSDGPYMDIIVNMFISCVRHVLLEHKDKEEAMKEFIKVFRMLCCGLVANHAKEEKEK